MTRQSSPTHFSDSATVADLLDRVLDKGLVISGDIRVKLVDVELLTIEVRLLICSVDRPVEMGIDWWRENPAFAPKSASHSVESEAGPRDALEQRIQRLEQKLADNDPST